MGIYRENATAYTVSVSDFDAIGTGDRTIQIQNAINATASSGTLFFPEAFYQFTRLTFTRPISLAGVGWSTVVNAAKGDAQWTTASNHTGTVLFSTATTGILLDFTTSSTVHNVNVRDLMLVGSGGTTSTGIFLGDSASPPVISKVMCDWQNVLVANVNQAYNFQFVEESNFVSLRSRGCSNGIIVGRDTNQNTFLSVEFQGCTDKAIKVNGGVNAFYGGLIQGCNSGYGIYSDDFSENNSFSDFWFENNTPSGGTFREIEWLKGTSTQFRNMRMAEGSSPTTGRIRIGPNAVNVTLENIRTFSGQAILNEGTGTRFLFMHPGFGGTFTDTGIDTFYFSDPNISGGQNFVMKLPHDLIVTDKIRTGNVLYNVAGTVKYFDAVTPGTTWTPTFSNVTNVSSFSAGERGSYVLVKGMVHCDVLCILTPTFSNIVTEFDLTLPFTASGALSDQNAFGVGVCYDGGNANASATPLILGQSTTTMRVRFISPNNSPSGAIRMYMKFHFPA